MIVQLPYGPSKIDFSIPDKYFGELWSPNHVIKPEDPEFEITNALDHPIGSDRLENIVRVGQRVNIICDDVSRPTPCSMILPLVIQRLLQAGIRENDIKIIMALGSHRYMTTDEMIAKVGLDIFNRFGVSNSEFRKASDLIDLGESEDGIGVFASRVAVDCDIRIGIGNIVPHPVMGWSGGAKILIPGVTGEDTVIKFHTMSALSDCNYFGMDECPTRLSIERWAERIGLHFIINTVLTSDMSIYKVVAGHYKDAHRKGVAYGKEVFGRRIKQKADVIIVSSYPSDYDFWQSSKGICAADLGLRDERGTILLVSPNYEGIGPHPEFADYFGMDNANEILIDIIKNGRGKEDPLAIAIGASLSKLRQRIGEIIIVGDGLNKIEADKCGMRHYAKNEIQKAVNEVLLKYDNPVVSAITHGGELFLYE